MNVKFMRSWLKHLDVILLDFLSILVTFVGSYCFVVGSFDSFSTSAYVSYLWVVILLHLFIAFFARLYSNFIPRGYLLELRKVTMHMLILSSCIWAYLVFSKLSADYSRVFIAVFLVSLEVLMILVHVFWKHNLRVRFTNPENLSSLLVITTADKAEDCIKGLKERKYPTFYIKGLVLMDEDKREEIAGVPVVTDAAGLLDYVCANVVDSVLIVPDHMSEMTKLMAEQFLDMGIIVRFYVEPYLEKLPNMQISKLGEHTVISSSFKTASSIELALKRFMDICGALVGLLLTGIAFIFVAPAIYIKSPGPIFFSQYRVGRNGRKFKFYKFRSMYMDAEERKKELMEQNKMQGLMFKIDDDPRIIKGIGHFIRDTSIDELPQFWNILKGDMSLVGTRPPTVDEFERYDPHHKIRLSFRPGLTGMWQVSGRSDITDFEEVVRLDEEYIATWNIWLDIKILLRTVLVVIRKQGSV